MNKKGKEIYILTAPFYKTGGTELCHQLVYTINSLGGTAYVLYKKADDNNYLNPAFRKYVKEFKILTDDEYDNNDGIIIVPESETLEIPKFKKATIYLWWMSVDNYYRWQNLKYVYEEKKFLRTVKYLLTGYQCEKKYVPLKKLNNVSLHLAQSKYAVNFLQKKGFSNIKYLSDFINDDYVMNLERVKEIPKEDYVIYNPSKGLLFTKKIIKHNKNIKFVPLIGMSNEEIFDCISRAKVYIDFGAHPGKDRLPREAAILGCCIITGKRGSAAFEDVDIPEKYKFEDKNSNIPFISETIKELLNNYNERIEDYNAYRAMIQNEKEQFYKDVRNIFFESEHDERK